MTDTFAAPWRKPKGIAARLVWPVAVVLAAAFGMVLATILWVSDSANRIAVDRQITQMATLIEHDAERRAKLLAGFTVSDDLWTAMGQLQGTTIVENSLQRAMSALNYDSIVVLDREGVLVARASGDGGATGPFGDAWPIVEHARAELFRRIGSIGHDIDLRDGAVLTPGDFAFGQLVAHDGKAMLVLAAPLAPTTLQHRRSWAAVVALRTVNPAVLNSIAAVAGVGQIRLAGGDLERTEVGVPVNTLSGAVGARLAWVPFRPGDDMRSRLIPASLLVLAITLIVSGLIFLHVQRVALDVERSEEHTRRLVGHDPLSGLPNRLPFTQRLDQELSRMNRSGEGVAVLFLDLDRFKEVNDAHGHAAGDELIRAVARRLANILRGADTLARFGGDEFAIIQTSVRNAADVEALARRILADITQPFDIAGVSVSIGVSIGISLAPQNGTDREVLMRLADTALYQAKNEGRNRFSFFERQMDETLKLRKLVEDDLRNAISNNELALYYQPQVSPDGSRVLGLEALIRWPHPKRGLISPAQFIPVAEERGLIMPLGEWVLRRACEDGLRWPGVRIAVNVSPIQFRQKDFVATVLRIVDETGFDPTRLELELTEGVVVDDADAAEAAMIELRAAGIHLALDDFGTGYSSLIYLRRFAFDKIKIDRSFLESMEATGESAILVHSMVHLGRALGLTVTAEGVETNEQHRFLQAVGCHELQGFLFSRPLPSEQVSAKIVQIEGQSAADVAAA